MSGVLVHEWIERSGGAEKVLDEFVNCYPDADLYCLWNDAPGVTRQPMSTKVCSLQRHCVVAKRSRCLSCRSPGEGWRTAAMTSR